MANTAILRCVLTTRATLAAAASSILAVVSSVSVPSGNMASSANTVSTTDSSITDFWAVGRFYKSPNLILLLFLRVVIYFFTFRIMQY